LLVAIPDLETEGGASQFEIVRSDCVLYFDDGGMVRLSSVPEPALAKLRTARVIVVAEYSKGNKPVRCYECERVE
jgi:hypothetical protein